MPLLYDITTTRPVRLGYGHTTSRFGCVMGVPSATGIGHAYQGVSYIADHAAVRANLPARYRAAFDRAHHFWYDNNGGGFAVMALYDARGHHINTIWATPYTLEQNTETGEFERRNLGE